MVVPARLALQRAHRHPRVPAETAILGTSRGGLIAMGLALTSKDRLLGVALNDIGPKIETTGLDAIKDYLGRRPSFRTLDEAIGKRGSVMAGFANVPETRWAQEVMLHFMLKIY